MSDLVTQRKEISMISMEKKDLKVVMVTDLEDSEIFSIYLDKEEEEEMMTDKEKSNLLFIK